MGLLHSEINSSHTYSCPFCPMDKVPLSILTVRTSNITTTVIFLVSFPVSFLVHRIIILVLYNLYNKFTAGKTNESMWKLTIRTNCSRLKVKKRTYSCKVNRNSWNTRLSCCKFVTRSNLQPYFPGWNLGIDTTLL